MNSAGQSSTENKEVYHSDSDRIFMVCKVIVGFSFIVVSQPAILILHFLQTSCVKRRSTSGAYLQHKYWQKLTVRKRRIGCVCV